MSKKPKTLLSVLEHARDLLARPNRWVQGCDKQMKLVGGSRLNCFCAQGAVHQAAGVYTSKGDAYVKAWELRMRAMQLLNSFSSSKGSVVNWNDRKGRTQEQVVRLFNRAIAKVSQLPA